VSLQLRPTPRALAKGAPVVMTFHELLFHGADCSDERGFLGPALRACLPIMLLDFFNLSEVL